MRKFLRIKFISVFVASVLIIGASGQGLRLNTVFCISGPSHATFEPVHNGTHLPETGESRSGLYIDEFSSMHGYGSCSDIPVFKNDSWQNQNSKRHQISKILPQWSASPGKIPDVLIHSFLFVSTADRSTAALLPPRAEVLRI
jgi:hypothetical protein